MLMVRKSKIANTTGTCMTPRSLYPQGFLLTKLISVTIFTSRIIHRVRSMFSVSSSSVDV